VTRLTHPQRLRSYLRHQGIGKTLLRSVYESLNRIAMLRIFVCDILTLDEVTPEGLGRTSPWKCRFLTPTEVEALARFPDNQLSPHLVKRASEGAAECLAFLDGNTMASFQWFTSQPHPMFATRLRVRFDSSWVYMSSAYTKPAYRGHKLHSIGTIHAVRAYTERGKQGLLSIADAPNFASRNSGYSIGAQPFGRVILLGTRHHFVVRHTRRCADYGFRLERQSALVVE
jgi:hypothetical protein